MNTGGTRLVNLTNRSTGSENSPAWSPDSTKIALARDRSGLFNMWTMSADGTGRSNGPASSSKFTPHI
jgi:Tol biopolymer transport system component